MLPTASAVFQNPILAQSAPLGVFTLGSDGRILSLNHKAAELWGESLSVGQDFYYKIFRCFSASGRELGPQDTPMAQAILKGHSTQDSELIVERANGSRVFWSMRVEPVFGAEQKILGGVAYFRKKEAPKPCAPSEDDEHLPTLIGYLGNDLRFRFANAAYGRWFGLGEQQIVGRGLLDVIGPDAYAEIAPETRLVLDGSPQEFERFIPTAANRYLLLRLVPDTAPGGFVRGTAIIGSDVTARRRRELESIAAAKGHSSAQTHGGRKLFTGIA